MAKSINVAQGSGYELWTGALRSAKYVVAPMVDQSELAWRMLSRKLGAQLCYTPMLHASVFVRDVNYRKIHMVTCLDDRPLIVQFCANNPDTLLKAAKLVEPYCDAVDLNLGCPQTIAKKGHYGAFLQEEWDLLHDMISLCHKELSIPITCKIRIFEDVERTVQYAKMLEAAGAQIITVHGRTKEQKGPNTGVASWKHVKAVKENVSVPVFSNGNIQFLRDVENCIAETKCDGVMIAEGSLHNPALFTGKQPPCWEMADEYIAMVEQYPCALTCSRGHLFKIWHFVLQRPEHAESRHKMGKAKSFSQLKTVSQDLKTALLQSLSAEELEKHFELDNIPYWRCQPYVRPSPGKTTQCKRPLDSQTTDSSEKKVKKEEKKKKCIVKERKWQVCMKCHRNPRGQTCEYKFCKVCCRIKTRSELLNCTGHKFNRVRPMNQTAKNTEIASDIQECNDVVTT
ncbi:tRNA-dihydrouridine(16/17) synthase [NAD(P)(+)]-like [Dysidea avara]|uniref:tRNA-dihydrouridine(16/17) synthase [NAD(P)(+)]-like n=1 Tax=Dysidea avara TaxID=196820 RepID=UPI00331948B5